MCGMLCVCVCCCLDIMCYVDATMASMPLKKNIECVRVREQKKSCEETVACTMLCVRIFFLCSAMLAIFLVAPYGQNFFILSVCF